MSNARALPGAVPLRPGAASPASAKSAADNRLVLRRATAAGFVGTFIEWFDYAAYGFLATVIAQVFFPKSDPTTSLLAAYAVFALSFIVRPIGGVIWGHFGDKFGRRNTLSLSILIMSGSTFLIAFLPTYAQVGLWAPLLLLLIRLVQGFSASGEYAGASAFIAEYAPNRRRGLYTSAIPAAEAAGLLFASVFVAVMHGMLSAEQLTDWGWRLPFLLAAPFGLVGRYIRLRLEDTPRFVAMEQAHHTPQAPLRELFRSHPRTLLIGFGVTCLNAVGFYLLLSYMPVYLSKELGVDDSTSFLVSTLSLASYVAMIFVMGMLSDRFGRKKMLVWACILFAALTVPLFSALSGAGLAGILLVQLALGAMLTINDGTLPCFLSESFPTRVRFSGFALCFNSANALFGGTAPLVATWLISTTGNKLAPAWYLVGAAVVSLIAILASRAPSGTSLPD
jgi:MHS family proline/betaine transporter-like MFS transporter